MSEISQKEGAGLRTELVERGFCLVKNVANLSLIDQIRTFSEFQADKMSDLEKEKFRHTGSLLQVKSFEEILPIVALPASFQILNAMGYRNPRYLSGYIISKPPHHAPPLYWHQDFVLWNQPFAYSAIPTKIFFMYYLVDTNRENGCLRVIPGTHRKRHPLHSLPHAHENELQNISDAHPALKENPDEIDVPVSAGDVVIGDARLLHSAHPNHSNSRRTVITLWYLPTFNALPDSVKAYFMNRSDILQPSAGKPENWSEANWKKLCQISADYTGNAIPVTESKTPDQRLK